MNEVAKHILNKFTSGRWLTTVGIVGTYCFIMAGSVVLAITGNIQVETFLALLTAFGQLALYIVKSYFEKERTNGGVTQ